MSKGVYGSGAGQENLSPDWSKVSIEIQAHTTVLRKLSVEMQETKMGLEQGVG